jgi:hypothetical protein
VGRRVGILPGGLLEKNGFPKVFSVIVNVLVTIVTAVAHPPAPRPARGSSARIQAVLPPGFSIPPGLVAVAATPLWNPLAGQAFINHARGWLTAGRICGAAFTPP